MGCVASSIDKEERVQICKERKRLMKQLLVLRGEFAISQLAYLRSLKNTGVTLRQFTESESLELELTTCNRVLPPSPPPLLPPSPPPPPSFSPELRKTNINPHEVAEEESISIDDDNESSTPPPPPILRSSFDYWDPFRSYSPPHQKSETVEPAEEENWAEAKTEFEEEDREEEVVSNAASSPRPGKHQAVELADDNSSMMSWHTKDTTDMEMVVWRNKKSLEGIVKELDDYFLKASAGGNQIAILLGITRGDISLPLSFKENKRKRYNSAKVFSALSWSWSSRSLQYTRHAAEFCGSTEPCRPGAHWMTLDKLYTAEQKLYKEVKEEEITKLEHERKSILLLKQEEENHDWMRIEKTRSIVESLETDKNRLQDSINNTCSTILTLIDEELYPQLDTLISGLMHMWRTMYECHQVQNHISQQLNHLSDNQHTDMTSEHHRQATAQLETEVFSWYNSFIKLITSQRGYVKTLSKWIQLTDYCIVDGPQQSSCSSVVHRISEEWQRIFDRLPDKIASEAIKSLLSAIQAIIQQQAEERSLHKKSDKLEKRLQKELVSLNEMERRLEGSFAAVDAPPNLSLQHPLSVKLAKTEALKQRAETEKAKYLNSVQVTRGMILNNLKTSLPNVFQALMSFSNASFQAFEAIHSHTKLTIACDPSDNSAS
ncbi:hypothetical protein HS088_TW14G00510 [Tripterygium wilfordii]|uniref:Uncharacterized protein n=1 Tax=Tripterygium wilfordii TaxID=458696 RepID=A0A7J7CQT5_TRIWF|nr:protein ALTERED PHOSPHATE STARVATION RESPONSE 1 [Tripterygium wilfordii]XP_038723686.1 protein ALTERED PHOSPHATE STARVATION RESPONSE 1 [Tripterygium wilfordii]XP_038723687.1 protein ALTERED PHOSPHATE STARVATION RESPONSE 1 [Tripterygium wilfordii]KAF5736368.1 hypothetical protein HS088_TW14G00510 [Tripterygium wilfordii]